VSSKVLLSIDGGGIRGIIPLCALIELERQTGRPARETISFVAGTSTGAIIAAGLARGIPAEQMLDLYQNLGPRIFRKDVPGWIFSLGSFKYRSRPLYDLLGERLGACALNQLETDVLITAKRVSDGRPFYFVRDNEVNDQITGKLDLIDCVTASSAAPTYFEPWDVPGIGPCVDGGVGIAGNPVYQMCVEAFYYTPPGAYTPADCIVVSLGTGVYDARFSPNNLVAWANWVVGELLMSPAEQQTELVLRHFQTAGTYRINPSLPRDIGLDSINAIPELIEIGRQAATQINWADILAGRPNLTRVLSASALRRAR